MNDILTKLLEEDIPFQPANQEDLKDRYSNELKALINYIGGTVKPVKSPGWDFQVEIRGSTATFQKLHQYFDSEANHKYQWHRSREYNFDNSYMFIWWEVKSPNGNGTWMDVAYYPEINLVVYSENFEDEQEEDPNEH